MVTLPGATAGAIVICRFEVAVFTVGVLESVTLNATVTAPADPCAGVPVIAPVELLIARPLGKPVALNL
jgi:hypothetical protein